MEKNKRILVIDDDKAIGETYQKIFSPVDRQDLIVQDLTTFSRVDDMDFHHADINTIMDSTLSILHNELKSKVTIIKDYQTLPEIKCFPRKLSQVFTNLIINACQAIDTKGTIQISTQFLQQGRRTSDSLIVIRIMDTGCGIPQENISQLFDPFFTTKPVGLGTGLGLGITYEIIKAHGGNIEVTSQVAEGSTFTILLPAQI